jgi:hypothetical protein
MIIVIVKASRRDDGSKAYSTRGQLFDGTVDGRLVVSRSTQPLLDACRILVGEGIDPLMRLVMRHEGQDCDALRSTVGAAAQLTVEEGKRRPIFRRWRLRETAALSPPMRQDEEVGVLIAVRAVKAAFPALPAAVSPPKSIRKEVIR